MRSYLRLTTLAALFLVSVWAFPGCSSSEQGPAPKMESGAMDTGKMGGGTMDKDKMSGAMDTGKMGGGAMDKDKMSGAMDTGKMGEASKK